MSRAKKIEAAPAPVEGNITCLNDRTLCGQGRCAKCEIARLNYAGALEREQLARLQSERTAYQWGVDQAYRVLLENGLLLESVCAFLERIREKPVCDPSYLEHLDKIEVKS